eukprot:GFUD01010944.1.p1 GENE.GFUD01010944.1~~GFUD01010944.1.p1  ORF type:complete len:1552 (+),score=561.52 GFUD01010944.1:76-4731(+)
MAGDGEHDLDGDDLQVVVRFVIPQGRTEVTVTEALAQAFDQSKEAGLTPVWVQEQEVLNISPTKTDVFVMDPFSGPGFSHVTSSSKFKCTVVGPRCLLACLASNTPVPELPYPMYTAAMKGMIVTISGLEKPEKEKLKQLVERMAGIYSNAFHDGVTHLVAATARSQKYEVAVGKETPCMLPRWVEEVWKVSKTELVTAVDPRFSSHRCPALLGVTVSVSQLNRADKELLKKSVETHGGVYSGVLEMDKTTVLVCTSPAGDKYSHAKKWKIPCVSSQWVFDCIEKGYCLQTDTYRVDRGKANSSTPTKQDQTIAGLAEVSMCSIILNPDETVGSRLVDDTLNCTTMGLEGGLVAAVKGKTTADWLAELELGKVKKAGMFLDGCKVYLSGFSEPEQVQLARVLKYSGGTRLTQLVESVTHCVHSVVTSNVASDTNRLLEQLDLSPHMVSIQWVVESMRLGKPVPEAEYPFPPPVESGPFLPPPSLLQPGPLPDTDNTDNTQFEANLLAQYGAAAPPLADQTTDQTTLTDTASMSQVQPFLAGLKLELIGFNEDMQQDLTDWVTEAGGELVYTDYTGVLDYLVVPVSGGTSKHKYKKMVSSYWLEDCLDAGELLDVQYHHHPLHVPDDVTPLAGVVTCLSGYNGKEREYLNTLVTALGGTAQEIFAKRDNKAKGAKGSTHLICPEGSGQKYTAAMKWGLPVVTRDWVTVSHREMLWISEKPFLVGEATAVTDGKPMPSMELEVENTVMEQSNDETITSVDLNLSKSRRRESDEITFGSNTNTSAANMSLANTSIPHATTSTRRSSSSVVTSGDTSTATPVTAVKPRAPIDTPGPGVDTPTMERLRPKPLDLNNISVTPQRWADSQPSPSQATKRKRDSTDALDGMSTPNTPYGAHWTPNPSPHTRKYYKKVVENLPRVELTELQIKQRDQFRSQTREDLPYFKHKAAEKEAWEQAMNKMTDPEACAAKHEEYLDSLEAKGIPVVGRDKRTFEEIMEEKYQKQGKSWIRMGEEVSKRARLELDSEGLGEEMEGESKVLEGVVLMVAKKLSGQSQDLHRVVVDLGGEVAWQFSSRVTHFVFQGKQNDLTKEFRVAKEAGCSIVSPDWVYLCRDEKDKVQETTFPHTFNPRLKLDITESSSLSTTRSTRTRHRSKPQGSKIAQPQIEETHMEEEDTHEKSIDDTTAPPTDTMRVAAEVSNDLAVMESLLDSVNKTPVPASNRKVLKTVLTTQDNVRNTPTQAEKEKVEEDKESQVLWVDPQEEVDRKRLAEQLNALETQDLGMDTLESMGSMNMDNLTAMMEDKENNRNKPKVFMVSGWTEKEPSVEEAVKELGGTISTEGHYDPVATHMLAVKVSRSEKMLGSVAAGKWVLHPSYVTASMKAGMWLDEVKFEWGNVENGLLQGDKAGMEFKLASAARKWRNEAGGAEGAFNGMRFILHMPENKKGPFSRLVKSGGGEVLVAKTPYSNTPGASHLLTETRYIGEGQIDFAGLANRGVPVMKPIYLNDFLTSDQPPALEQYLLDEFKTHWDSKKRNRVTTDTPTNAYKKTKSVFGNI